MQELENLAKAERVRRGQEAALLLMELVIILVDLLIHSHRTDFGKLKSEYESACAYYLNPKFLFLATQLHNGTLLDNLYSLHDEFYDAAIHGFMEMKREAPPGLTDTELNHRFFTWQMDFLKNTGSYCCHLRRQALGQVKKRHACSEQFLHVHENDRGSAYNKASHRTILWVSVHTPDSIHEPHMTEDSLVSGAYYVRKPPGSGKLALYDPRGFSPMLKLPANLNVEPKGSQYRPFTT